MNESQHLVVRRIPLASMGPVHRSDEPLPAIDGLYGIEEVASSHLKVSYDVMMTRYGAVCQGLRDAGYDLRKGLLAALQRSWYEYLDGTLCANLGRQQKRGCCSNPTDVYVRHKSDR